MKILILTNTVCGGVAVDAGQVVDASEKDARTLLAMRRAVPAPPEQPKVAEVAAVEPPRAAVKATPKKKAATRRRVKK